MKLPTSGIGNRFSRCRQMHFLLSALYGLASIRAAVEERRHLALRRSLSPYGAGNILMRQASTLFRYRGTGLTLESALPSGAIRR